MRAAALFTSAPFGMTPIEHNAWLAGDGADLWRKLYSPFDVMPFAASNTGPSLGVWTREPIRGSADLKGLKMRIAGLGGELFRRLGVTPVSVPPGEIGVSLKSSVIDAAEFASAVADESLGLYSSARYCQIPAFHEPNGVAEALVGKRAWAMLDRELQAIVSAAFAAEHDRSLAESLRDGTAAIARMRDQEGTIFRAWPDEIAEDAAALAPDVINGVAEQGNAIDGRIVESYRSTMAAMRAS
jgi:TRAP-type mannitol/chloroaromatic compound transport system substrate-binding protein